MHVTIQSDMKAFLPFVPLLLLLLILQAERWPSGQLDLKELCVQKAMCGINHRTKWIRLEGTSELLGLARCPDAFYNETY